MSEGPEVRRTADRIAEALVGGKIDLVDLRRRTPRPGDQLIPRLIGARVKEVRTHGKHLVVVFTRGLFLHNHMMMWGKWRTYSRAQFDVGKAAPPPRIRWRQDDSKRQGKTVSDVRDDSRVRLVLATPEQVAIQFNGPMLHFSASDPANEGSIARLGPDGLAARFGVAAARRRLRERGSKSLSDLLLDQTFVAGVGNKYKSEILFLLKLPPFLRTDQLNTMQERDLLRMIPRVLRGGYRDAGRTRPLQPGEAGNRWDTKHWVFRRGGRPCWICGTAVKTDRKSSARVTYFCPTCQSGSQA